MLEKVVADVESYLSEVSEGRFLSMMRASLWLLAAAR